jgi:hypothetical protein
LLIHHQSVLLFSRNKPATSKQPAVLFSQNKPALEAEREKKEYYFLRSRLNVDCFDISKFTIFYYASISTYLCLYTCKITTMNLVGHFAISKFTNFFYHVSRYILISRFLITASMHFRFVKINGLVVNLKKEECFLCFRLQLVFARSKRRQGRRRSGINLGREQCQRVDRPMVKLGWFHGRTDGRAGAMHCDCVACGGQPPVAWRWGES